MMALLRKTVTMPDIKTKRLHLVTITPKLLVSDGKSARSLALGLKAKVTTEWPPEHWEPNVLATISKQTTEHPRTLGWNRYVLLPDAKGKTRTLIGCCGGFPGQRGDVEVGYSTLPAFQRSGYATEAVAALIAWLLERDGVSSVSAQTFARLPESVKVMERCGMTYAGLGDQPGTVRYRRSR